MQDLTATPSPSVFTERSGKTLIDATRPFAREDRARSRGALGSTLAAWALATAASASTSLPWTIRLFASLLDALLIVRLFVIYHDFMHGAVLRGSRLSGALLRACGVLVMAPPSVWRDTHNYHHAHTAQLIGSNIGSFAMVTTEMWKKMPPKARVYYRIVRHPLTIVLGYFTIFMLEMCARSFLRSPRKYWDSGLALALNWTLTFLILRFAGVAVFLLAFFLPLAVACMLGAYLFYAQHNFPAVRVARREGWSYAGAALESSSYLPMGPVMAWFTGNIGFHHVHHLNAQIPFYRLPEAMRAIPELQHPGTTTLNPRDVVRALSLKLWDHELGRMVGYPSR